MRRGLLVLRGHQLVAFLFPHLHSAMDATQRNVALWSGILTAPIAWAADLQLRFALVQYVCRNHAGCIMWLITLVSLLISAFVDFVSTSVWVTSTTGARLWAM